MSQDENFDDILGEKDLFFFASVWIIAYAECTNEDVYLPMYDNREELFQRINRKMVSKSVSWFDSLIAVLQEDHPGIEFNCGISEVDIVVNSRNTQIFFLCEKIRNTLKTLETTLKGVDQEIKTKIFQDGGLVNLGPYFRSWLKYVNLVDPEFRLGGEEGQAFILKEVLKVTDLKRLSDFWLRKVSRLLDLEGAKILVPNPNQVLSKIPSETTTLSAMSISLRIRCLLELLCSHHTRDIFRPISQSFDLAQALDKAKDLVFSAYQSFSNNLETCLNGISLQGLESEISFNKKVEGFKLLGSGIIEATEAISRSVYDKESILKDIKSNVNHFKDLSTYVEVLDFLRDKGFVES